MRLGVAILPDEPWAHGGSRWSRAEALGFAHAWTYDHISWRSLRNGPWFGAIPTLVAAASVTSRIRLGTLVSSPNFRHPVPFARDLLALDDLSAGRTTLGIGAGTRGDDAAVLGDPPLALRDRADRFENFVTLLDELLTSDETTAPGRYFSAVAAPMRPGCVQEPRIPFVIAATGPRGYALAARYGQGWVTTGDPALGEVGMTAATGAASVRAQMDRLDAACDAAGRDPTTLERIVLTGLTLDSGLESTEMLRDTMGEYASVGVTELVVHWPRADDWFVGDADHFAQVIDGVT